jgi:hypothetical protein
MKKRVVAIFSVFASVLFMMVLSGCGRDRIADFERINTSPLNYLATKNIRNEFYQKLSFEKQRVLMDKKSNVFQVSLADGKGSLVKLNPDYILICVNDECRLFSDSLLTNDFIKNVIDNRSC